MSGPLTGFRVIDVTTAVLGPVATQLLGDLGADVIKIETREGDITRHIGPARNPDMAAYFLNLNRNKRSVVLDLKQPEAHEALLRLAESADVFLHNMRLGAIERLGLDYAALRARNPRIVYAAATGFDPDGPMRDRPAYDDAIQGESGFAWLNGTFAGEPRFVPMAICDKIVGQMLASAVGMALLHRERTGVGQQVLLSMRETSIAFNMVDHLWHGVLGEPEKGLGYPRMFTPHRRPYATTDGHLCIIATTDRQWHSLFAAFDRPELTTDPRFSSLIARTSNIDALYGIVVEVVKTRSTADWQERLAKADVPHGTVASLQDLIADQSLWDSGFFTHTTHPTEGPMITTGITMRFSESPGAIRLQPPRLGEHTDTILASLGLSPAQIAKASGETAG